MTLDEYQKYNRQFREKYIYRLGGWTGFFSEYNNMVIAMFYCIINHKQFVLQSCNANFSSGLGWTEFFLPFCEEIWDEHLERYNYRKMPPLRGGKKRIKHAIYTRIFHRNYHYTYEFFDVMRTLSVTQVYSVPELGLSGNMRECCSQIHKMIWRYNQTTRDAVQALINSLRLPVRYVSAHIRQGDKILEADVYTPEHYVHELQKHTDCRDVFVLTDDYRAILSLKQNNPEYHFYTLCQPDEEGYDFDRLHAQPYPEQQAAMYRLWASMDVMEKGQLFVGTFSANPGMNMGFRLPENRLYGLDFEEWQLW